MTYLTLKENIDNEDKIANIHYSLTGYKNSMIFQINYIFYRSFQYLRVDSGPAGGSEGGRSIKSSLM